MLGSLKNKIGESVAVLDMGNWGRLFQMLVAAPKWITWLAWTNKIRILNEAKLETRVITIGERLGGMWSVCRPKLGHPARRDWGQGELAESPNTPNVTVALHRCLDTGLTTQNHVVFNCIFTVPGQFRRVLCIFDQYISENAISDHIFLLWLKFSGLLTATGSTTEETFAIRPPRPVLFSYLL